MTHLTLTSFLVFFAMAAFGAIVFTLAHFASHGAFSPDVTDESMPENDDAADEDTAVAKVVEDHDPHE